MGKKKSVQHVQQSMGQMISKAALAQLGPSIERYVEAAVQDLGSQLATQQASTLQTLFSRMVVLEGIVIEKLGYSKDDLSRKVAELEDEKEGLLLRDGPVEANDVVRLQISTKTKDQDAYQGTSRLKVYDVGAGNTLGTELEPAIIGMALSEEKEVEFGKDKQMLAKIKIDRISYRKPAPKQETPDATNPPQA